jgi:hypothetical protein
MTGEQADHALALWLLWKEARKQPQQLVVPPDVDAVAQQLAAEWLDNSSSSSNGDALGAADSSLTHEPVPPAAAAWEYSRDEVAQMMASGQLTGVKGVWVAGRAVHAACHTTAAALISTCARLTALLLPHLSPADELSRLWQGPLGAAQRSARLLCLAAAAGDVEELQVRAGGCPR